jgi:hypothetical protein
MEVEIVLQVDGGHIQVDGGHIQVESRHNYNDGAFIVYMHMASDARIVHAHGQLMHCARTGSAAHKRDRDLRWKGGSSSRLCLRFNPSEHSHSFVQAVPAGRPASSSVRVRVPAGRTTSGSAAFPGCSINPFIGVAEFMVVL